MTSIDFAPSLVEEALFHVLGRDDGAHAAEAFRWDVEREALYRTPPTAERERAFEALASRWFRELDLARPFHRALESCPHAAKSLASIHVRAATRARDEGSELYGPPGLGGDAEDCTRLVIAVKPEGFADPEALHALALRELLYAEDMRDPAFGYRLELPIDRDVEPARAEVLRDRYSVLWEARVLGRASRIRGNVAPPPSSARFRRAFGANADRGEIEPLFAEAWCGRIATQRELMEHARTGCSPSRVALR